MTDEDMRSLIIVTIMDSNETIPDMTLMDICMAGEQFAHQFTREIKRLRKMGVLKQDSHHRYHYFTDKYRKRIGLPERGSDDN